jgi:hypothetical protein
MVSCGLVLVRDPQHSRCLTSASRLAGIVRQAAVERRRFPAAAVQLLRQAGS